MGQRFLRKMAFTIKGHLEKNNQEKPFLQEKPLFLREKSTCAIQTKHGTNRLLNENCG